MTSTDIEKQIIEAFVVPSKRARFLEGLANPKKRPKTLDRLYHHIDDLDSRYRWQVPSGEQSSAEILANLKARGAPDECYIVSCWDKFDQQTMPLRDALEGVVGYGMGTIISCIPGRLAYYEAEEPGQRFILERATRSA